MRKHFCWLLCLLCGLWSRSLQAQSLSIHAEIDKTEMKTGEQAAVYVKIRTNDLEGTKYYLLPDSTGREYRFKVLEFAALDTVNIDDRLKEISARLLITSFDSTLITIPSIVAETATERELSRPLALKVTQPEVDLSNPEEIKDIKAPWDEELTLRDLLEIILKSPITWLVVGLLLISLLGWFAYKEIRRRRSLPPAEPEVILTPLERALAALDELSCSGYIAGGKHKQFFSELTDIMRLYMQETQDIEALEMTSYELLRLHRERELEHSLYRELEIILTESDLVKFAKSTPDTDDARSALMRVRTFVQAYRLDAPASFTSLDA